MNDLTRRSLGPLAAATAVACPAFLYGLHVDALAIRVPAKPWIHLLLVGWILAAGTGDRGGAGLAYARRVATAIAVCMVADVVLEFRGPMFLAGMGIFLAAQLTLASAFAMRTRSPQPLAAVTVTAALGAAFATISPGLGAMRLPVMAYMTAIGTMMWRALAGVTVDVRGCGASARLAAMGALVFGVSDTMIALDRFHAPFAGARYLIILTYWAALALLAGSAVTATRQR